MSYHYELVKIGIAKHAQNSFKTPWDRNRIIRAWNVEKLASEWNITRQKMERMCELTYWNTWTTCVNYFKGDGTTFVITGDIPAMWIRDSTEQMWPYWPLAVSNRFPFVTDVIRGLIIKQAHLLNQDAHANVLGNAFVPSPSPSPSPSAAVHSSNEVIQGQQPLLSRADSLVAAFEKWTRCDA